MSARSFRRLARVLGLLCLLFLLAGCAHNGPQDYFNGQGGAEARTANRLFQPVFWIAVFVFFFVEGLILFIMIKFRDRPGREEPKQIHGNSRLEFTWTVIPALVLLGISIPTVITIFNTSAKHTKNEIEVKVVAHQWWWEYHYLNTTPEIVTANELVIPTGRQIYLDLDSADVIHSFWVPKLAGKMDVVPDRTNTLQLEADTPANYYGQCAEFCSLSHANMRLRVIAKSPADYDAWVKSQQAPPATDASATQGHDLFFSNACIQCHTINGTDASGTVGPNLTHFASRGTFAGATYPVTAQNLASWISASGDMKPGSDMPNFKGLLTSDQINAIVAYLLSLK